MSFPTQLTICVVSCQTEIRVFFVIVFSSFVDTGGPGELSPYSCTKLYVEVVNVVLCNHFSIDFYPVKILGRFTQIWALQSF